MADLWQARDAYVKSEQRDYLHQLIEKDYASCLQSLSENQQEQREQRHKAINIPPGVCGPQLPNPLPMYMNKAYEDELDEIIARSKSNASQEEDIAKGAYLNTLKTSAITPFRLSKVAQQHPALPLPPLLWGLHACLFLDLDPPTPFPIVWCENHLSGFSLGNLDLNLMNELLARCDIKTALTLGRVNRRWRTFVHDTCREYWSCQCQMLMETISHGLSLYRLQMINRWEDHRLLRHPYENPEQIAINIENFKATDVISALVNSPNPKEAVLRLYEAVKNDFGKFQDGPYSVSAMRARAMQLI